MKTFKKIVIAFLLLLIAIPVTALGYTYFKLNSIHEESSYVSTLQDVDGVTNILLTGIDARPGETSARTDSMMILTINDKSKKVKLTSLARDTYVNLAGKGKGKLNAAYFWGQEPMLFGTIENEFGIKVDKMVQVDFNALMAIIDIVGGVEVDVPANNLNEINKYSKECYDQYDSSNKGPFEYISSPGRQTLNGYQALSFSRVRKQDSAINRDERQQEVMMALTDKVKTMPLSKYPELMNTVLPYVKTNVEPTELLKIGMSALSYINSSSDIEKAEFPIIDNVHVKGGIYQNAGWVWLYDLNSVAVLQDFIYRDINMSDNDYMKDNSKIQLNY